MGAIPTLLYFAITFPLYGLWLAILARMMFGKLAWRFILFWSLLAGVLSTCFSTLGELLFGLILTLYLIHHRRSADTFWVFVMMDLNLIIINIGSIILEFGKVWYPHTVMTVFVVVRVGIIVALVGLTFWLLSKQTLWLERLYDAVNNSAPIWKMGLIYTGMICLMLYVFEFIFTIIDTKPVTEAFVLGIFILSILLSVLSLAFALRAYRDQTRLRYLKASEAAREEYYANLEVQQTRTRQVLHDYKNILAAIRFSLAHDPDATGTQSTDTLIMQAQAQLASQQPDAASLAAIACSPLRSLIYLKWTAALNQGVQMNLETKGKQILASHPDVLAIVRIVGILIDNALEATVADQKHDFSVLIAAEAQQSVEITVINTVPATFKLAQLNQAGYTTKGVGHGNGLMIIKQLLATHHELKLRKHLQAKKLEISLFIEGVADA